MEHVARIRTIYADGRLPEPVEVLHLMPDHNEKDRIGRGMNV
jgi:hypothetical protein